MLLRTFSLGRSPDGSRRLGRRANERGRTHPHRRAGVPLRLDAVRRVFLLCFRWHVVRRHLRGEAGADGRQRTCRPGSNEVQVREFSARGYASTAHATFTTTRYTWTLKGQHVTIVLAQRTRAGVTPVAGEHVQDADGAVGHLPVRAIVALSPYASVAQSAFDTRCRDIHAPVMSVTSDHDGDAFGLVEGAELRDAPFIHPAALQMGVIAAEDVSTAFLDTYLMDDPLARQWLQADAKPWLGATGELRRKWCGRVTRNAHHGPNLLYALEHRPWSATQAAGGPGGRAVVRRFEKQRGGGDTPGAVCR